MQDISLWQSLQDDFHDFTDVSRLVHIAIRLIFAAILGGVIGYQREKVGKSAGLRTHMLVTMGTAFFIMVPQHEKMPLGDMSRIIQGIVTGIGFLGGGAILKLTAEKEIHGLTTAAGIWLAAAVGVAVGFGRLGTAVVATLLAFVVLDVLMRFERKIDKQDAPG
jgi:putative Mg2+ transporter-C (MgtC) family protein